VLKIFEPKNCRNVGGLDLTAAICTQMITITFVLIRKIIFCGFFLKKR
jgi:hypothetical protein